MKASFMKFYIDQIKKEKLLVIYSKIETFEN